MRHLLIGLTACLATITATPAAADCAVEIRSQMQGGAWDPFVMGNRRMITVHRAPDGTERPYSDVLWDGPIKSINCTPHGCFMAIGNEFWNGISFDGPWTKAPTANNIDPEEFARNTADRLADSVADAQCVGEVDLNGKPARLFKFSSKPEPNEHGAWWGGDYSVWIDVETDTMVRIELANSIASWAPQPSKDVQITTVEYDDSIRVNRPAE